MKIIYFNGFAGSPDKDSLKVKMFEELGTKVLSVNTQGSYTPKAYVSAFEKTLESNKIKLSDSFVLAGISLGGFWARFFGYKTRTPWIALNPSLTPSSDLMQFVGTNTVFDTGQKFNWTQEDCAQYRSYESYEDCVSVPGLIIFSSDDDVIDHSNILNTAQRCQVIQLSSGGHRLQNTQDYKKIINDFLSTLLF